MADFRALARTVIATEIAALQHLSELLDSHFDQACELI